MKEKLFNSNSLIKYQRYSRNLVALYFITLTLLSATSIWVSVEAIYWGVVGLLLIALLRVLVFAHEFRKAGLFRFSLLSYLLGVVILSTVALKYWIL
ncbi:MAG: hypothetical protein P1R58_03840 [bacterium]|nr:hypothetical protein [bacterium]